MRPIFVYSSPNPHLIASVRLSAIIPASHIGTEAAYFGRDMDPAAFLDKHRPTTLIITKAFDEGPLHLAKCAVARGVKIVTELCNSDQLSDADGKMNAELAALSAGIVVHTPIMAKEAQRAFGKPCTIIEEPTEYPRGAAAFNPGAVIKLLWFGISAPHDTLHEGIKSLLRFDRPMQLLILSNEIPTFLNEIVWPPSFRHRVVPWAFDIQYEGFKWCDLVFLPGLDRLDKQTRSPNRLVESINAGRLAIAHPLPQYQELADFCVCRSDYVDALRSALADLELSLAKIQRGQRYIAGRYSPHIVSRKWADFVAEIEIR